MKTDNSSTYVDKHEIKLLSYDEQPGDLSLKDWIYLYYLKTGNKLNPGTMRKRRAIANIGHLVPPKTYIMSRAEFEVVMKTPLPMCSQVVV